MDDFADFIDFDYPESKESPSQPILDFSSVKTEIITIQEEPEEKTFYGYTTEFDKTTLEHYRVFRQLCIDPISGCEIDKDRAFVFEYMWDPYTGERLPDKDPNGGLCFDPDQLIKYFCFNRLNKLWVDPKDIVNNGHGNGSGYGEGYFQGHYDDGVGAGENFYVASRGYHPEWYLFRLPISDCYLTKEHNTQILTFGPKLTNEEIQEIDRKAKLSASNYIGMFRRSRPSLVDMKKWYDRAIALEPDISHLYTSEQLQQMSTQQLKDIWALENRSAVEQLRRISG